MIIKHAKNNQVKLRNFNENVDLHDVVKLLFVRMLRRKYPESKRTPIYTEYDSERPNEHYPDIWFCLPTTWSTYGRRRRKKTKDIYVVEIQDKVTKKWTQEMIERYEDVNLIIIPLKGMPKTINGIKKKIEKYLV